MVLETLPIEDETFLLFTFAFRSLVKTPFSFVAQPFALEHLLVEIGKLEVAAFVEIGRVPDHVP